MRTVTEWIGKSDDSMPPPSIRLRIFNAHKGICHISGRKIAADEAWDLDHILAICNGGENRESNLAPALKDKHQEKTKLDRTLKKVVDRKRSKAFGMHKASNPMPGSRNSKWKKLMNGQSVRRDV